MSKQSKADDSDYETQSIDSTDSMSSEEGTDTEPSTNPEYVDITPMIVASTKQWAETQRKRMEAGCKCDALAMQLPAGPEDREYMIEEIAPMMGELVQDQLGFKGFEVYEQGPEVVVDFY